MSVDIEKLQASVGKTESRTEVLGTAPATCLAATLDRDDPPLSLGDSLPPLAHWLHFLAVTRQSDIAMTGFPGTTNWCRWRRSPAACGQGADSGSSGRCAAATRRRGCRASPPSMSSRAASISIASPSPAA